MESTGWANCPASCDDVVIPLPVALSCAIATDEFIPIDAGRQKILSPKVVAGAGQHLATATRQAPRFAQPVGGEERELAIDLSSSPTLP